MTTMPLVDQEDGEKVLLEAIPRILHHLLGERKELMLSLNLTTTIKMLRMTGLESK